MPARKPRAPQQERSRQALARLVRATAAVLEARGLEGASIPRIARQAGVAPSSIYRRFRNQDALFRAVFLDLLTASVEANARTLRPELFEKFSFEVALDQLVGAMIRQYREHPGLLRALSRFSERAREKRFAQRAMALVQLNFERIVALLLLYRSRIHHPDPLFAVTFGLLSALSVIETNLLMTPSLWETAIALSPEQLRANVAQSLLAFLTFAPQRAKAESPN